MWTWVVAGSTFHHTIKWRVRPQDNWVSSGAGVGSEQTQAHTHPRVSKGRCSQNPAHLWTSTDVCRHTCDGFEQ